MTRPQAARSSGIWCRRGRRDGTARYRHSSEGGAHTGNAAVVLTQSFVLGDDCVNGIRGEQRTGFVLRRASCEGRHPAHGRNAVTLYKSRAADGFSDGAKRLKAPGHSRTRLVPRMGKRRGCPAVAGCVARFTRMEGVLPLLMPRIPGMGAGRAYRGSARVHAVPRAEETPHFPQNPSHAGLCAVCLPFSGFSHGAPPAPKPAVF